MDKSFNNISNSKIYVNSSTFEVQSQLSTTLGKDTIIGREKELQEIDERLNNSNSLLLINGIGGIGKSTIASYYLHSQKEKLDYYGFFDGLDSFTLEFKNSLDLKAEKEEDIYYEIISKLQKLQGKKLLVIDKVEDVEKHKKLIEMILSLHKYDYKILFTSRRKIKQVTSYYLGTLLPADAQKLFLSYCKSDELEKVDRIINDLGLHTLFIKLVAETIENEGYTLDDILKKFERGELSKIELIDEESGDEVTFNQNLQKLFSMLNLKDEYVLLLKRLSVLPSIDIELSFLEEILGKERLKGRLNFLVGRGWLIENKGSYKLHQIIKEFILANYHPSYFEEIEIIVEFFSSHTNKHDIWIVFLESIAKFLEKSNFKSKTVLDLYFFTGQVFFNKYSNYESSKKYLLLNEKVWKELNLEYDIESTYHLLARIFEKSEKLDDALAYINQALEIFTDKKEKKSIATCYDDIASIYWNKKLLDKALSFFDKALSIYVELDNLNDIAIVYNNISLVYKDKENYAKSHNFLQEALDLNINDKKNVAQFYNNRGELYTEEGKYELAEEDILLAFKMREELYQNYELDENHDYFAESYDNLAIIYLETEKYKKAKREQNEAIKIWSSNHDDNYSYLIEARERLVLIEKKLQDE